VLLGREPPLTERGKGPVRGALRQAGRSGDLLERRARPALAQHLQQAERSVDALDGGDLSHARTLPHSAYRNPILSPNPERRAGREADYARMPSGMRSPCARMSSSHIEWMSSSDRVAAAFGSSIAAW